MSGSFAEGLVGVVLDGRYRLDAVLGEGGMGAVFRAQHLAMDRKVAVKLLKPHLTTDRTALERFAREARATLKVDSPHAVKVLDFGVTPHGDYYMALEYLDGRTVQRELEVDGPFAPLRVLHVARQALHALGVAHARGLVHRDIKPDNILLMRVGDDPDYTKLLDFGVAKLMQGTAHSSRSELQLTQAGMVFGTPEFMSPEQACGHPLDGRSDLYSLGATMFAMLTGCGLFEANQPIEWLTHHVRTPPPHLATLMPELASLTELDDVIQSCLAKHREKRPESAEVLAARLAALEAYVRQGGATVGPRGKAKFRTALSASAYFQALPAGTFDAGETLLPAAAPTSRERPSAHAARDSAPRLAAPPSVALPADTGPAPAATPRRGLYLALGGLLVVAVLAIAIGVAVTRRGATAAAPDEHAHAPGDARPDAAVAAVDAAVAVEVTDAPMVVADAPLAAIDAAVKRPPADAASSRPRPQTTAAREHLANAEVALRAGNRLRQLAEADLALQADPRSVRAKYLLADALIKGGDLDRGCGYLRALGRNPLAVARAKSARCPTD